MKGLIFTGFIEFVEEQFGESFVDDMIDALPLSTEGAYTAVGTYPATELLDMIGYIDQNRDVDIPEMAKACGQRTFHTLAERYPDLVSEFKDSFECIYQVDQVIHKNVRKLYPDAELPDLNAMLDDSGNRLTVEYRSSRPLMYLAHGLLLGCIEHYGDSVTVQMTGHVESGNEADFLLIKHE